METSKDKGWSWVILFGVFLTTSFSFGFTWSTGVFFVEWQEDFEASAQAVGWSCAVSIGGIGLSGLVSSVISPYVTCRWQAFAGGVIASMALMCAPWVTHIGHLYIIMAVNGFGVGFSFVICVVILSYYFDKKLALANGIGLAGSVGGMLLLAPLIRYLNDEYSWRGAMLICGGMLGNICVFASLFRLSQAEVISMTGLRLDVKDTYLASRTKNYENEGRVTGASKEYIQISTVNQKPRLSMTNNVRRHSQAFVKSYTTLLSIRFVMFGIVSSMLQGFAFYSSLMYFVSNAIEHGISKKDASFLLSIFGICGLIGRLTYGPIIDRKIISPFYLGSLLLGIAGSSCFLGSLARSYVSFIAFTVVLGFSSSTYSALYKFLFREVVGNIYFKKMFGIGMIIVDTTALLTIPFMGYLYDVTGDYRTSFYAAGSAMLLNSMIVVLDNVWIELDRRRLRSKECLKDVKVGSML